MDRYISYSLYCGRDIESGGYVSDAMLAGFLKSTVDTIYSGYTVVAATGVWNGHHEKTAIIEILIPSGLVVCPHDAIPAGIFKIARAYELQFEQRSVMIKISSAVVQF